jgi:hypothetical protein
MKDRIHKDFHPELGCSGNLNLTRTVHSVNVGTSYLCRKTGLAATDVRCEGRETRSSLSQIRSGTWRRGQANCYSKEVGMLEIITEIARKLYIVTYHVIALLYMKDGNWEGAVCAKRCKHGFDVREIGNTLGIVTSHCE